MIPNKEMSLEEVKRLLHYHKFSSGGEATICESNREDTLYKIFTFCGEPIRMSDNKLKKLEILYELNLDQMVRPVSTISIGDTLVGYEMTYDYDFETYKMYELSLEEKISILKKSKEVLEYFSKYGVIYGDIDLRNILINRNTLDIMFCDIDNVAVGAYPMDILPFGLEEYSLTRGIDLKSSAYMLNTMSLRFFEMDIYCTGRRVLLKKFKRPADKIVSSMKDVNSFNGEYLISHIKQKIKE